jgi:hypothetical protein
MPVIGEYSYNLPEYFYFSGVQNDLLISANFLFFAGKAPAELTGIQAPAEDQHFAFLLIQNGSFSDLTIKNDDPGSSAEHRFYIGADMVLNPGQKQIFYTDGAGWYKL